MKVDWQGVFPAVTTQFREDRSIDHDATAKHIAWLIDSGVHGLIMLGTCGENCSLEPEEKRDLLRLAKEVAAGRVPVLSGVAECRTEQACRFAADAEAIGIDGLMVLPAMVYAADNREAVAHFRAVARASGLPIMIYNNPIAYKVDLKPSGFAELAGEPTIVAIKESSDDVRRVTDLINEVGDRYVLFCGVDDLALESAMLGVVGWVSGLVNVFPEETMAIWRAIAARKWEDALPIYRWFMPLLHLDTEVKLVQNIKLAQALVGRGSERMRLPRLELEGAERARVERLVAAALANRPR